MTRQDKNLVALSVTGATVFVAVGALILDGEIDTDRFLGIVLICAAPLELFSTYYLLRILPHRLARQSEQRRRERATS